MLPDFLTPEDILQIHEDQIDSYGGIHGLRDRNLMESAVATPQATFGGEFLHQDLFEMAAAYAFYLSENQPFLDGNKRTALHASLLFLDLNGYEILDEEGRLFDAMIAITNKEMSKQDLANLLKELAGC